MTVRAARALAATLALGVALGIALGTLGPLGAGDAAAAPATGPRPARGCRDCGTIAAITVVPVSSGHAPAAKHAPARRIYQVSVRMNDGTTKTIRYDNRPALAVGDAVRVTPRRVYLR